jgi:hypothetical protein
MRDEQQEGRKREREGESVCMCVCVCVCACLCVCVCVHMYACIVRSKGFVEYNSSLYSSSYVHVWGLELHVCAENGWQMSQVVV